MIDNHYLLEEYTVVSEIPKDLNASALVGKRIPLHKFGKVAFVVNMGDSVGAVVTPSFQQHDAAAGGNSKALSIANIYYVKAGAATSFTKVEPTAAASSFALAADFAAQEGVVVFEVWGADLDVENNYAYVSMNMADSTAAKIVSVTAILGDAKNVPSYGIVP